jgi:Terminase small subunit
MTAHRGRPQSPFSFREREFVCEFLRSFNRTTAALKAGYTAKRADKVGSKLLATPRIRNEIARRQGERLKKQELTAERTLEEIRRLAMSDITNYFDDEGRLLNLKYLPEDMRAAIASVKLNENGKIIDLKLWPKPHALHLAATHLRLLVELSEQKTSLEIRIREMTPDQRKQYAIELLEKARKMLPVQINASPAEYAVVSTNGIGEREAEAEADDGGGEV